MRNFILCAVLLGVSAAAWADQVVLTNAGGDTPIALVDAQFGDCENDTPFTSVSPIDIGDATEGADCDAEIIVFSDDNAIAVVENPGLTAGDDMVTVALQSRWVVPVRYWVATIDPVPPGDRPDLEDIFKDQVDIADQAFNESHAGISFAEPTFDYEDDPTWGQEVATLAQEVANGETHPDVYTAKLAERITPLLNTMNVYAVQAPLLTGFHLGLPDGRSSGHITIGVTATMSTLAHELGHAMSLDHISFFGTDTLTGTVGEYCVAYGDHAYYDGTCDYDVKNLMWAGQSGPRDEITEGQGFRTNVNTLSFINGRIPPIRPLAEPQRDCADWIFDRSCPYLALDEN